MTTAEKWQLGIAAVGGAVGIIGGIVTIIRWAMRIHETRQKSNHLLECLRTLSTAVGGKVFGESRALDDIIREYVGLKEEHRLDRRGAYLEYTRPDGVVDGISDRQVLKAFNCLEVEATRQGVLL